MTPPKFKVEGGTMSSNGAKASKGKQKQANGTIGCTAHAGTNRAKLPTPSNQGYSI
jgi:hypothetical protein